jgi:phosphate transport system protein
MLSEALGALADEDAVRAADVRAADTHVDDLQKEVFAWVQREIPRRVEITDAAIDILSAARKLERIADTASAVAADVIFMAEGEVVRHRRLRKAGRASE